jgi:ATP sulfurylase
MKGNVPSNLLQLRGPATALSRKCLHDMTIAGHFKSLCNMHNTNNYNENWKIPATTREQLSVRGSISVTARPRTRAA